MAAVYKSDDEPDVIVEKVIVENGDGTITEEQINTPQCNESGEQQGAEEEPGTGSGKRRRRNRRRGKKNADMNMSTDIGDQTGQGQGHQGERPLSGQGARPRSGRRNDPGQGQHAGSPRGPRPGQSGRPDQWNGSPHTPRNQYYRDSRNGQQTSSPGYTGSPYSPHVQNQQRPGNTPGNGQRQRGTPGSGQRYRNTPGNRQQRNTPGNRQHRNTPGDGQRQSGTPGGGTPSSGRKQNRNGTPKRSKKFEPFESYMSKEDIQAGLKRSELIQGRIRINPKSFEDSFVSDKDSYADIHIFGLNARNRALEGDVVVVKLLPKDQWKVMRQEYEDSKSLETSVATGLAKLRIDSEVDATQQGPVNPSREEGDLDTSCTETKDTDQTTDQTHEGSDLVELLEPVARKLFTETLAKQQGERSDNEDTIEDIPEKFLQKRGKVVYIVEKKHSRAATGHLKLLTEKDATDALFSPIDHRLPRIRVPLSDCPDGFAERPGDFASVLFVGRITDWPQDSSFARGSLHKSLGEAGEIEPETEGFLIENDVDFSEFSDKALQCLPDVSADNPWKIPDSELQRRRDLRKQCIFTIDPSTARDLDDALSCNPLPDGTYEVGVHIADVSYFLKEDTELDNVASNRATSVYLVQKVIPMLPRLLCEQLCSLNPAEDRLTFSVIWKLSEEGQILDEWVGRSVIRSCVKMTYQHAQRIIENPTKEWTSEDLPPVTQNHSIANIVQCVLNLNKIAVNLRRQRFEDGALRLDQPKLSFAIEGSSGLPNGCSVYEQQDSNRLVEEFMLLANMAVAHHIYRASPKRALLRRHPKPKTKMIDDVVSMCSKLGMSINAETAGSLQASLREYHGDDAQSNGRCQILVHLCSKPMQMAKYFCTGFIDEEAQYRHYALNVPFYTHFTSPIRRYADVVVHRLLAESLKCGPEVQADLISIQSQAEHCNDRKTAAKRVQDLSMELFFAVFIKECGPIEEEGMVLAVLDHSVDVLVLKFGVTKRVYCNALQLKDYKFHKNHQNPSLTIIWDTDEDHPKQTNQTLRIFSPVNVILCAADQPLKYSALIKRPESDD